MNCFRGQRMIFAVLTLAVFGASVEAKLSMYLPEHTPGADTCKIIKLQEVRIGPVALGLEVSTAAAAVNLPTDEDRSAPIAPLLARPGCRPSIPQCHWSRPPPPPSSLQS